MRIMACAHCSVESSPHIKGEPAEEELVQALRDAAAAGANALQITGGEPMIREAVVMRLLAECRELGIAPVITTNAFWGKSPEKAAQKTKALSDAGVVRLTISYDGRLAVHEVVVESTLREGFEIIERGLDITDAAYEG